MYGNEVKELKHRLLQLRDLKISYDVQEKKVIKMVVQEDVDAKRAKLDTG